MKKTIIDFITKWSLTIAGGVWWSTCMMLGITDVFVEFLTGLVLLVCFYGTVHDDNTKEISYKQFAVGLIYQLMILALWFVLILILDTNGIMIFVLMLCGLLCSFGKWYWIRRNQQ